MTQNEIPQVLSRRTATRGSKVQITLRTGEILSGQLVGWGAQVLTLALDSASKRKMGCNWKRNSFSTFIIDTVTTA